MKTIIDRKWNVGKVSVILLIFFSMTDLLLNLVDAQMDTLGTAFDDYDALSSEVIRPAFRYRSANVRKVNKPKLGLGSAAISSVTEALSPILPFTGGVDLRREDYWTNGVFGSFSSVLEQVRDAFAMTEGGNPSSPAFVLVPRGGAKVDDGARHHKHHHKSKSAKSFALSSTEPFVSVKDIAQLTLRDIAMAFRFAFESTRKDFNKGKFFSSAAPRAKKVFERMSEAAAQSRGKHIRVPITGAELQWGDVDALHFCAAMRIFAEWRVLRQVPDGYKGYAVGMSLGQKDVIQNVAKIEQAVHSLIEHRERILAESNDNNGEAEIKSPTLRELLQYEVDTETHGNKLPRLKEKSGAMGLLWVRRQLDYQTGVFSNVLKVPEKFESTRAAVSDAYSTVYDRYHGWTVQKIFNYSFQAAPEARLIYRFMNPELLKEVTENAGLEILGSEKSNRNYVKEDTQDGNVFNKLGRHIGNEWGKLTRSIVQVFDKSAKEKEVDYIGGGSEEADMHEAIDDYINREMEKDAHEQIVEYLNVAEPILLDLARLFDEFNMDDPTKV